MTTSEQDAAAYHKAVNSHALRLTLKYVGDLMLCEGGQGNASEPIRRKCAISTLRKLLKDAQAMSKTEVA